MKEKVNVTGVPETMIQTLYARAKESEKRNSKIQDTMAVEIVAKLDYDFSNADKDKAMSYGVVASGYQYRQWFGYEMLSHEWEIFAVVQHRSAGNDADPREVSDRKRTGLPDC